MSNNRMNRARASMDKAMKAFEATPPEEFDDEAKSRYKSVMKASHSTRDTTSALSARVIAENPGLYEKFMELHREAILKQMSEHLSDCPKLLEWDPDALQKILNLPLDEMSGLARAASVLQQGTDVALTVEEAKAISDQASVISVMEERPEDDMEEKMDMGTYPLPGISY